VTSLRPGVARLRRAGEIAGDPPSLKFRRGDTPAATGNAEHRLQRIDSFAPTRLKLARFHNSLAASLAVFTLITRTSSCSRQLTLAVLPSIRAIPDRDVFYVAFPQRSIRPLGLSIYVALVSAAPFASRLFEVSLLCEKTLKRNAALPV
jgi:hypothetical protein